MLNREFEPSPDNKDRDLLEFALMFDGVEYCNGGTKEEIQRARKVLIQQHENVVPKFKREAIRNIVTQNDSAIQATREVFNSSLSTNNLGVALGALNYLYAYGDMDYNYALGGDAFAQSLDAHRVFTDSIFNDLIDFSQVLAPLKKSMLVEIAHYREQIEPVKELSKLREIIHLSALDGVLGAHAKQQFDPFAIPAIGKL